MWEECVPFQLLWQRLRLAYLGYRRVLLAQALWGLGLKRCRNVGIGTLRVPISKLIRGARKTLIPKPSAAKLCTPLVTEVPELSNPRPANRIHNRFWCGPFYLEKCCLRLLQAVGKDIAEVCNDSEAEGKAPTTKTKHYVQLNLWQL